MNEPRTYSELDRPKKGFPKLTEVMGDEYEDREDE